MAEECRLPVQESSWSTLNLNEHTPLGYEMQILCSESKDFPDLQEDIRNAAYEYQSMEHESAIYFSKCESSSRNCATLMDLMQESIQSSNEAMFKESLTTGYKWTSTMAKLAEQLGSKFYGKYEMLKKILHKLRQRLAKKRDEPQNTAASDNDRCNENVFRSMFVLISKAFNRFINWLSSLWKTSCADAINVPLTEQHTCEGEEAQEAEEQNVELQGAVDEELALEKITILSKIIRGCQHFWERVAYQFHDSCQKIDIATLHVSYGGLNAGTAQLQSWKKQWQNLCDMFNELFKKSSTEEQALDALINDELPKPFSEEWNTKCGELTAQIQSTDVRMRQILHVIAAGGGA